jgi:putative ABC transport system permease protein
MRIYHLSKKVQFLKSENLYLMKFAWKSIHRHSGRSFFIGFSVSLAVVIAVWVIAFFDGLNSQIEKAVVDNNTGFYQLQEINYSKSTDSTHPLTFDPTRFQNKNLQAVSPELVLDANISTPEGSAALSILGIVPELHQNLLPIQQKIKAGEYLTPGNAGAMIGKDLADFFHYKVGDQLVINYQDVKGELRSELLPITAIYRINSKSFEKRFVYINQTVWQTLFFGEVRPQILFNRIVINTPTLAAGEFLYHLNDSTLVTKSWKQLNPEMAVVLEFHDGMIKFFFIIIAVTILMTILTPVQMLWQERLKELRMMNILGVTKNKFWKLGFFEALQMIIGSFLFSTVALLALIGVQSYTGVDFRFLNEGGLSIERAGIKLPGIIYPILSGHQLAITFIFVMFVLGISYLWSIRSVLKKLEVSP